MFRLDLDLIRHALQTATDRGFATVEIGLGDDRFEAKFQPHKNGAKSGIDLANRSEEETVAATITASSVGYYRPGEIPLEVGQEILAGDIVGEIVALGLKNDVVAKLPGTITRVLVELDQPVEYGQVLATLSTEK